VRRWSCLDHLAPESDDLLFTATTRLTVDEPSALLAAPLGSAVLCVDEISIFRDEVKTLRPSPSAAKASTPYGCRSRSLSYCFFFSSLLTFPPVQPLTRRVPFTSTPSLRHSAPTRSTFTAIAPRRCASVVGSMEPSSLLYQRNGSLPPPPPTSYGEQIFCDQATFGS